MDRYLLIHAKRKRNTNPPAPLASSIQVPRLLAERQRSSASNEHQRRNDRNPPPLARILHLLPPRPLASLRVCILRRVQASACLRLEWSVFLRLDA